MLQGVIDTLFEEALECGLLEKVGRRMIAEGGQKSLYQVVSDQHVTYPDFRDNLMHKSGQLREAFTVDDVHALVKDDLEIDSDSLRSYMARLVRERLIVPARFGRGQDVRFVIAPSV